MILVGDCVELMAVMPDASVDAVVTDPPYGLGFMGKTWDSTFEAADVPMRRNGQTDAVNAGAARQGGRQRAGLDYQRRMARDSQSFQAWCEAWATEVLRVLKPGGHLLAFGGTRTYHRLACAVEDAGFEIRDTLCWLYGSGFPKSLDVSKAIDKAAGVERATVLVPTKPGNLPEQAGDLALGATGMTDVSEPVTPEAERWQGWGTALKPAHEPSVVARKPLGGTVAGNVLEHGTGALNVDGCRIESEGDHKRPFQPTNNGRQVYGEQAGFQPTNAEGRWPANVVLDEEAAAMLDEQTGELHSQDPATRAHKRDDVSTHFAGGGARPAGGTWYGDVGGASRFFYVAKASRAERNAGLEGFEEQVVHDGRHTPIDNAYLRAETQRRNTHPTVKPVSLMRWLVRLVTPPGGLVLDPFAGSGTTGIAAALEGFQFTGCEQDADYAKIAEARIAWWAEYGEEALRIVAERERAEDERESVRDAGQLELL